MPLSESDTRAKLIDPALHLRGWTEDLIKREETAGGRFARDEGKVAGTVMVTEEIRTPISQKALPEGWRWARLGELLREAQAGFAIGERDPAGVIQLRMNNVTTDGRLDWGSFIRVPATSESIERYHLVPGDVMFNNTNSTELVGKSAIFDGYNEAVVYSNHFTRLRALEDSLDPRFLALWLREQWRLGVFAGICNRWIGQSAVKNEKLLALEIAFPRHAEQRRIATRLSEIMADIDRARAAAEAELDAINALPAKYLRRAFSGEL